MDPDQEIRLRVENEVFVDVGPVKEPKMDGLNGPASVNDKTEGEGSSWNKNAPYTIIVSLLLSRHSSD
jgi:hypothetical protein